MKQNADDLPADYTITLDDLREAHISGAMQQLYSCETSKERIEKRAAGWVVRFCQMRRLEADAKHKQKGNK
jgi:hypothetical protein